MKLIFVIPDMSWLYDYKAQFPLGILYLARILKERGWEVEIFDSNAFPIETIKEAEIYAFSVVYNTMMSSIDLSKKIKHMFPNSKRIVGGVGPTLSLTHFTKDFDSIFMGESENTIKIFLEEYEKGIIRKIYKQEEQVDISNLLPDRSVLEDSYIRTSSVFTGNSSFCEGGSTSIIFSRGCPSNCIFCCSPKLYNRRVRFRPIDSIEFEVKQIIEMYGIKQFRVQDDTFTLNKTFVEKLTSCLKKLNIFYRCSTRADRVSEDIIDLLYESGCREIGLGVEAADNACLELLKKDTTVEQIETAISIIRKYPIKVRCFFMIGYPFDSFDLMYKNIDFIEKNNLDNVVCCNLMPFPGTALFDNKEKFGITHIKEKCCMNIASHIPLAPNYLCSGLSEEKHIEIMKIFYEYLLKKEFIK